MAHLAIRRAEAGGRRGCALTFWWRGAVRYAMHGGPAPIPRADQHPSVSTLLALESHGLKSAARPFGFCAHLQSPVRIWAHPRANTCCREWGPLESCARDIGVTRGQRETEDGSRRSLRRLSSTKRRQRAKTTTPQVLAFGACTTTMADEQYDGIAGRDSTTFESDESTAYADDHWNSDETVSDGESEVDSVDSTADDVSVGNAGGFDDLVDELDHDEDGETGNPSRRATIVATLSVLLTALVLLATL